jgi:hypothetical protein
VDALMEFGRIFAEAAAARFFDRAVEMVPA